MRILVIEDSNLLRDAVCQGLREEGFAVDSAADGTTGLWYAQSCMFDVIVLDLMLPGLDGLTLLKRLRESGGAAHVLILTAKDATNDRVAGLDAGADDYLIKPFDFSELLARVRALLRRAYMEKNPVIDICDLRIDTTSRHVMRGGTEIELTPREYALLEYLAMRQGQVVSRTDIWEHIYEFNVDVQSNVVDVCIAHLRKKLESDGRPRLLHTRRGHGYLLGVA